MLSWTLEEVRLTFAEKISSKQEWRYDLAKQSFRYTVATCRKTLDLLKVLRFSFPPFQPPTQTVFGMLWARHTFIPPIRGKDYVTWQTKERLRRRLKRERLFSLSATKFCRRNFLRLHWSIVNQSETINSKFTSSKPDHATLARREFEDVEIKLLYYFTLIFLEFFSFRFLSLAHHKKLPDFVKNTSDNDFTIFKLESILNNIGIYNTTGQPRYFYRSALSKNNTMFKNSLDIRKML